MDLGRLWPILVRPRGIQICTSVYNPRWLQMCHNQCRSGIFGSILPAFAVPLRLTAIVTTRYCSAASRWGHCKLLRPPKQNIQLIWKDFPHFCHLIWWILSICIILYLNFTQFANHHFHIHISNSYTVLWSSECSFRIHINA